MQGDNHAGSEPSELTILEPEQQTALEVRARARSVERARIVLLAGAGLQDREIALRLKVTPAKAARWRKRFLDGGLSALEKDAPRAGRTP
jgi:transposase